MWPQGVGDGSSEGRGCEFRNCHYIRNELGLNVTPPHREQCAKRCGLLLATSAPLTEPFQGGHLGKRKEWVDGHIDYPPSWWESRLNLVLDGVTLTMPTKTLHGREKHAA